ncbi:MAG: CrcB family protein [Gordonia sp. (in: high G+C Gram-positive bacteria)]
MRDGSRPPRCPNRPLHARPGALAWVFGGGLAGTAVRYAAEEAFGASATGWPWATFGVNLAGAFILGALLEGLALTGPDEGGRQRIRLAVGTGFCGSLTTYSALALETSLLTRHGVPVTSIGYAVISVVAGMACAWLGIAAAGAALRTRAGGVS